MDFDASHVPKQPDAPGVFLTTRWSRVVMAGDATHPDAHAALSSLCQDYWRPLYYFARRKGHSPEDAQDLTQGFIMDLVEHRAIAAAERERGRFRSFLIKSFTHYLANWRREQTTQKRGGDFLHLSLDEELEVGFVQHAVDEMTPERLYECSWAMALLERVMKRLEMEYAEADRRPLFEAIQPLLSGADARPGYGRLAETLGMSENAIGVVVHRMRRRYGALLREEVAGTVATPEAVEEELRYLIEIVSTSPLGPGSL